MIITIISNKFLFIVIDTLNYLYKYYILRNISIINLLYYLNLFSIELYKSFYKLKYISRLLNLVFSFSYSFDILKISNINYKIITNFFSNNIIYNTNNYFCFYKNNI